MLIWMFLVGCGEPLADGSYAGTELFSLTGEFTLEAGVPPEPDDDLLITVFWAGQDADEPHPVEVVFDYPAYHRVTFYNPMDASYLVDTRSGSVAMGVPVVFIDEDGNGEWTPGETVQGFGETQVFYAPEVVEIEMSAANIEDSITGEHEGFFVGQLTACSVESAGNVVAWPVSEVALQMSPDLSLLPDLDCDGEVLEEGELLGLCSNGECKG